MVSGAGPAPAASWEEGFSSSFLGAGGSSSFLAVVSSSSFLAVAAAASGAASGAASAWVSGGTSAGFASGGFPVTSSLTFSPAALASALSSLASFGTPTPSSLASWTRPQQPLQKDITTQSSIIVDFPTARRSGTPKPQRWHAGQQQAQTHDPTQFRSCFSEICPARIQGQQHAYTKSLGSSHMFENNLAFQGSAVPWSIAVNISQHVFIIPSISRAPAIFSDF
mmetsp:Transcript_23054/g.74179  ORF Transcript_23054/g.74179 Transcript_23054/m.74179 type:complete len:224 (-) Transcript_23054:3562-4233(-)